MIKPGDIKPGDHPHVLKSLTSIRFFAAFMIVWLHIAVAFKVESANTLTPDNCGLIQGVSCFFVLSGFILSYNYKDGFSTFNEAMRFIGARFARIWPAHAVTNIVMMLSIPTRFWFVSKTSFPLIAAVNFGLLQSLVVNPRYCNSINPPSWSVSTEFAFYLLFPFLIPYIRTRWLQLLLFSIAFLSGCLILAGWCCFKTVFYTRLFLWLVGVNPLARVFEFVLGMVACRLVVWNMPWLKQRTSLVAVLECSGLFLVIAGLILAPKVFSYYGHTTSSAVQTLSFWLTLCGGAPAFALLIAALSLQTGPLARLLQMSYLVALGEISYSIYLMHYPVMLWFQFYQPAMPQLAPYSRCFFYFVVLLSASALLYKYVEVPARKVIRNWTDSLFPDKQEALPLIEIPEKVLTHDGVAR